MPRTVLSTGDEMVIKIGKVPPFIGFVPVGEKDI